MNNNENNKENINKNELGEVSGGLSTSDENMKEPREFCGAGELQKKFPIKTIDPKTGKISGKDEKNKKESLSDNDLNAASGGTIISTVKRVKDPETGEWKIMHYNVSTGEWVECGRLLKKNIDPETTEPKNTNGIKT